MNGHPETEHHDGKYLSAPQHPEYRGRRRSIITPQITCSKWAIALHGMYESFLFNLNCILVSTELVTQ